jgi:hypothetical protein
LCACARHFLSRKAFRRPVSPPRGHFALLEGAEEEFRAYLSLLISF